MSTVHQIVSDERGHSLGRPRVPEPMVMNELGSVEEFHAGGAAMAGMRAVYDLNARSLAALIPRGGRLLDLGVGSGRALGCFLAMRPDVRATGLDLASNMLAEARRFLDREGLGERVTLVEGDLTALPDEVSGQSWDAISSVWTLHHMPDLEMLRAALHQIARLRDRDRSAVWLLDLQRLHSPESFRALMTVLQPDMSPILRADGLASEAAAFTHDELRAELAAASLGDLDSGLAQPIAWLQAFWCHPQREGAPEGKQSLGDPVPDDAPLLRGGFSHLPL